MSEDVSIFFFGASIYFLSFTCFVPLYTFSTDFDNHFQRSQNKRRVEERGVRKRERERDYVCMRRESKRVREWEWEWKREREGGMGKSER